MSFANLKKKRQSNFDKLKSQLEGLSSKGENSEEEYWKPVFDKDAGIGSAVIRFLPPKESDELPWVKVFSHYFQGSGGWYIEKSLTTIGQKDPVYELNGTLYNSGDEALKLQGRKQKRNVSYYANKYVVKDPANPDNEGKVFLYKFGTTIFNKIKEAIAPKFEDEEAIDPFDLWEGANFKIRMKMKGDYLNYDDSAFDRTSSLHDDEDFLEKVYNQIKPLSVFTDPSTFKSYDQLKARLDKVLGKSQQKTNQDSVQVVDIEDVEVSASSTTVDEVVSDPDDALALFEQLSQ